MSSTPSVTASLNSSHFEFPVRLEDPQTGLEFDFTCEIDTGCPFALCLPRHGQQWFTEYITSYDVQGAGTTNSPAYRASIKSIGGMDVGYETMAIMTLEDSDYGLIGIELLNYLRTEIHNDPNDKKLTLEKTHL